MQFLAHLTQNSVTHQTPDGCAWRTQSKLMPDSIHLHQNQLFMSTNRIRASTARARADLFSEKTMASRNPVKCQTCRNPVNIPAPAWTPVEPISAFWPFSLLTFREPLGALCKSPKEAAAVKDCLLSVLQSPFTAALALPWLWKLCRTWRLLKVPHTLPELWAFLPQLSTSHRR